MARTGAVWQGSVRQDWMGWLWCGEAGFGRLGVSRMVRRGGVRQAGCV